MSIMNLSSAPLTILGADGGEPQIIAVDENGQPIIPSDAEAIEFSDGQKADDEEGQASTDTVAHPAKVMRIGTMIKTLLDEVRQAPLDEAGRARLKEIHQRSISELEDGLSPDLVDELERLSLPFAESQTPSEAELRIAQAQLVGWLEGLFHGIQTALFAQQMAAQAQLQQMRRPMLPGAQAEEPGHHQGPGQYL